MSVEDKLEKLGITLPEAPKPLGSYVPCVQAGNLLFLSGTLPLKDGKLIKTGQVSGQVSEKIGESVSIEEAQECARQCVINALSVLKAQVGNLDKIKRCVKLNGYVASAHDFTEQPKVLNAASDLLFEIFGEAGRHARAAVGVSALPLNSPIEIDFIFEIKP
ncbi:MAG: RidA family protein [Thermodesulfovibrionales bacterium]|nr:RidA family protein [Thermodesulfovibrionales bacterium]